MGSKSGAIDSISNSESGEINKGYDLEDALIFKLASRLGGRSEILDLPLVDALAYLLILFEQEEEEVKRRQMELYLNHISRVQANPAQSDKDAKAKAEFLESLNPLKEIDYTPVEKEWNFDQLEQLKALQEMQN